MAGWHLEYTADVDEDNRIVYEKIFGVWKPETARSYAEDFKETTADLVKKKEPWAKLCDLTNWKTASPEAIEIIGKHLVWCRANNMALSVNIIENPVTFRQLHKMFDRGGTKSMSKTFRTRSEGEAYLREKGYKLASDGPGKGSASTLFRN
ncbi:MAG: hypothetical protein ABIE70_01385 [bacterium]